MADGSNVAPVIIKRRKVVAGGGHHGGAWKVAYADFVTAMMAFFMLMWLLNATTEKQRKGIADYFSPTIPISRVSGGGNGNFGGESVFSEEALPQDGTGAQNRSASEARQARGASGLDAAGSEAGEGDDILRAVEDALLGRGGDSMARPEQLRHIVTRVTDEGLVIELFDLEDAALFDDSDRPTALLHGLARMLARVAGLVQNAAAIEAHVAARPLVLLARDDMWADSAGRAETMRRLLGAAGLAPARMRRVTGHGDREPVRRDPMAVRNNRLEVILLRSDL